MMIHIVFNAADIDVLKTAQQLDDALAGEVVLIRDDFAVGPIGALDSKEGWQARREFWKTLLQQSGDYDVETTMAMVDDKLTVHKLKQQLDEDNELNIWIWAAQNQHDVSGYYWLVNELQQYQGRIFILYLNNLPFISDKGTIFYPQWLHEIPPKEYLKAKRLARTITPSEFEVDCDEWKKLCSEGRMVRRLEGGKKLVPHDATYFDAALQRYVHGDFSKASRILSQFFTKEKETTGDVFLIHRLKHLAAINNWEVRGDWEKSTNTWELRDPAMPSLKKNAKEAVEDDK